MEFFLPSLFPLAQRLFSCLRYIRRNRPRAENNKHLKSFWAVGRGSLHLKKYISFFQQAQKPIFFCADVCAELKYCFLNNLFFKKISLWKPFLLNAGRIGFNPPYCCFLCFFTALLESLRRNFSRPFQRFNSKPIKFRAAVV